MEVAIGLREAEEKAEDLAVWWVAAPRTGSRSSMSNSLLSINEACGLESDMLALGEG